MKPRDRRQFAAVVRAITPEERQAAIVQVLARLGRWRELRLYRGPQTGWCDARLGGDAAPHGQAGAPSLARVVRLGRGRHVNRENGGEK